MNNSTIAALSYSGHVRLDGDESTGHFFSIVVTARGRQLEATHGQEHEDERVDNDQRLEKLREWSTH